MQAMRNALIRLAALVLLAVSLGLQAGDVVTPYPLSTTESHYHWFVIRRHSGCSAGVNWFDDFFEVGTRAGTFGVRVTGLNHR